jgi:MFS family permease
MIPVIGKDTLHAPPVLVGLLSTAESIGALIGALLVANFTRQRWFGPAFLAGSFATMTGALVFGLAGWYPLALAALAFAGLGSGIFATTQSTLILVNAPPERRSRTMGVLSTFIGLGQGGVLAMGPAAALLGAPYAVAAFQAIGIVLLVLCALAWPWLWKAPPQA